MTLFESVINVFAPHNCIHCGDEGEPLCKACWGVLGVPLPERCYKCYKISLGSKTCKSCRSASKLNHVWVRTNYNGVPKELIQKLKFERMRAAANTIATAMVDAFPAQLPEVIFVPVVTATTRHRQRGYDQAVLMARALGKKTNMPTRVLLARHGQSRQVRAKKIERQKQLQDAFRVTRPREVAGAHIILIDDVVTTGATIEAAAQVLRTAGARTVDAFVFAQA